MYSHYNFMYTIFMKDPPNLQLQKVVSCLMRVLGTKFGLDVTCDNGRGHVCVLVLCPET